MATSPAPTEPQLGDPLPGTMEKIKQSCNRYGHCFCSKARDFILHMILGSVSSSWEKRVLGHLASCGILNDSSQEGVGKSSLINHIFKVEEAVRRELLKCPRFSSGRLHRKYPNTHREQPTSTRKYSLQQMILSSSTIRGAIELEKSTIFKN